MNIKKLIKVLVIVLIAMVLFRFLVLLINTIIPHFSTFDFPENTYQSLDGKVILKCGVGTYTEDDFEIQILTNIDFSSAACLYEFENFEHQGKSLDRWKYVFACEDFMIYYADESSTLYKPGQIIVLRRID